MGNTSNWTTIAESQFPWERDALDFVRQRFPSHEPYRAWSNFEFIADDGSINEVDLLVFTPQGFFLIEIKSRPGRLFGDAGTWIWETDGRLITVDNPLIAANSKAKKLRSLLQRQSVSKKKGQLPFLEALVFCSAPDLRCELKDTARYRVCLRDRQQEGDTPPRSGIMAAILHRRDCAGLEEYPKGTHDRPTAKTISQALEQAGIRPSQRHRRVGDYVLDQIMGEGPGYQDWHATHVQLADVKRRVRLYLVRTGASEEDRETIRRSALREFRLLEKLEHPGILRSYGLTEHELGPAVIFEHDPAAVRLDHFLMQQKDTLSVDLRLDLLRQIAEVIRFAHEKKVVHRSLCPQSILVSSANGSRPHIKVFNWQVGYRTASSSAGVSREVTATSHVNRLVEDISTAYMAPETLTDEGNIGEYLDVFSLGAIAHHVFSGVAPATNGLELSNKLRESKGLSISAVLNGAGKNLQFLVQYSTHPEVANRLDSVVDFLSCLDEVEDELTTPEKKFVEDPSRAQKGDLLPDNYQVVKRLGQGACAVALLVEREEQEFVLKVANDANLNPRLKDEAEVLQKLRHPHIVEYCNNLVIGDRQCVLMRRAGHELLSQRLRKEGPLHLDLLQRFGEDLLSVVNYLEEQGIPHRDIKPDNIGVGPVGRGDRLHLVLFDFSLSRTSTDNIYAGTTSYLDPLLPLRKPPRWDLHAERYAAAVTLYELATGTLPQWGDGKTDPSHLECEITIDAERFDASVRDGLTEFFQTAFRRDPRERFDNAEEMLRAWRSCFEGIEQPGTFSDHENEGELRQLLAEAAFDTQIPELRLGTRAINALDRANILTVEDLLTIPLKRLMAMPGVGNKTRREIALAVRILRERLGQPQAEGTLDIEKTETPAEQMDVANLSVDLLAPRVIRPSAKDGEAARQTLQALLALDPSLNDPWPSQSDVARLCQITRARVGQLVGKFLSRWTKDAAITRLRESIAEILERAGGVMTVAEVVEAVLVARGSIQDEPQRTQLATAVVRASVEVERMIVNPRFLVRRNHDRVFVALTQELASYANHLGDEADTLADEDPLVPPARVVQRLRDIPVPTGIVPLSDSRLIRLAAAASQHAAVSSRQELYPRGMEAIRALKLSQGALYGVRSLTIEQIRERVSSRYPEAASLPNRPLLDDLLRETGFEFEWDAVAEAAGCYVNRWQVSVAVSSGSESLDRLSTTVGSAKDEESTPEIADARQFEERLQRGIKDGSFLALLVNPKCYQRACRELCRRFPIQLVDFEALFLDTLQQEAEKAKVNWDLVLKTDAAPHTGDWDKLMLLVGRTIPLVEQQLVQADKTMLVIYAGLLARYDQMTVLERLRDKVGRREGIPGLWLLVPNDQQAVIDGKAVPIISAGQRAQIPQEWLCNTHRGN